MERREHKGAVGFGYQHWLKMMLKLLLTVSQRRGTLRLEGDGGERNETQTTSETWTTSETQAQLVECSFLVPIVGDSDRRAHTPLTWRLLHDGLHRKFGGRTGPSRVFAFRSAEIVPGGWSPDDGAETIEDESRLYKVSVPEDRLDELRALLRKAANSFDQQVVYLSIRGFVEFVEPGAEDAFLE